MDVLISIALFVAILAALLWFVARRSDRGRRGLPPSYEQERHVGPTQYGIPRGVDPQSMGDWGPSGGAP